MNIAPMKHLEPTAFVGWDALMLDADTDLHARASQIVPDALELFEYFDAEGVAQFLAYAAARLERCGLKVVEF